MLTHHLVRLARQILRGINIELVRSARLRELEQLADWGTKSALLGMMRESEVRQAVELFRESPSQSNQDFFVLHELGWKRDGYFVEFGAADGRLHSNTYLLETRFGWTGILAEPGRNWRDALSASGRSATIDFDCVWSRTGDQLTFMEASWAELSTIQTFSAKDGHNRRSQRSYKVNTVSLNDLLERHAAPNVIDYLSIDTEGSEFDILSAIDFDRFRFRCITCEHNFTNDRSKIYDLLIANGYTRVHTEISQVDDWYIYSSKIDL